MRLSFLAILVFAPLAPLGAGCGSSTGSGSGGQGSSSSGGCTVGEVSFSPTNNLCCRCEAPPDDYSCSGSFCPPDQPRWRNATCSSPAPASCNDETAAGVYCGKVGDACTSVVDPTMCFRCAPAPDGG